MTTCVRMANNTTTLFSKGFPHFIVSDVLLYIVSTSVLVINAGIILMFLVQRCRRPSKSRLSPTGALVINLLISDALVGAMGIFITASFTESGFTSWRYGCVNRITPRFFFRMGSHMALINVAIDRYIAIMHTLHYRDWVTMERCVTLIGIGWIIPFVGTAYAYLANDWWPGLVFCYEIHSFKVFLTYIRLPCHIAALIAVIFIQCRIFLYLRNHERNDAPQYLRQYSRKSAQVLFWVTTTYIVCWLPFDIMLTLMLFLQRPYLKIILDGMVILAYCSFFVNASIFSYKTENIRKPVSDLWRDICKAVAGDTKTTGDGDVKKESVVSGAVKRGSRYSSSSNITITSVVCQNKPPGDVTLHI